VHDITWFLPEGDEISEEQWQEGWRRCFGLRLAGDAIEEFDDRGQPIVGSTLMILFNTADADVPFRLPPTPRGKRWQRLIDTSINGQRAARWTDPQSYPLRGRSLALLHLVGRRR
jgi:glycogen operon protein